MTAVLVKADSAHSEVISSLHALCFKEAWNKKAITDILSMPGASGLIVTSDDDAPQGFVLMRLAADEAEIISIGVIRQARRSGLADLLLEAAIAQARKEGTTQMFLEVAEDNVAAMALYEKAGFSINGRRTGYYKRTGGNTDAIAYGLKINAK
jgi:[ribosomal protein S18]-alanine N-acetyltransferase